MTNENNSNIINFNEHINQYIDFETKQKCSGQKQAKHGTFYRLYKFLLFDVRYKSLHLKSKALYTLITDTFKHCKESGHFFTDNNGYNYIEFDTVFFKEVLNMSSNALTKYKKELMDYGLIRVVSQRGKQRLYLNMPKLSSNEFLFTNNQTKNRMFTYIEVPKFLFEPEYESITLEAAFIYSLLRDNQYISIKNSTNSKSFVDKHGDVFTKYSYARLTDALNIKSKATLKKHINILVENDLLIVSSVERKLVNCFKTQNRFYVLEPNNSNLVQETKKENKSSQNNTKETEENFQIHNNFTPDSQNLNPSNNNSNNNINLKAPYISEANSQQNIISFYEAKIQYLQTQLDKYVPENIDEQYILKKQLLKSFPKYISTLVNNYTSTIQQAQKVIRVICGAKNTYNELYKTNYNLEDLEMEIGHAVIRVNNHHKRKNKNISEVSNYLFESIKNVFKKQHEKDYEDGFIDTNPEMALFGDLAKVFNLAN
ncbi:replication initiator protein A [Staphylococcus pseudintermedius]|uniref:replication initiator protein A n=1 Tax=Staphylococcus pseudintermedius TaxID=283734 RepID=UPI003F9B8923